MAIIKCKYRVPRCQNLVKRGRNCNHYSFEFHEASPDCVECGQTGRTRKYTDDEGTLHIDICDCIYLWFASVQFEKEVKSYELDEEYFTYGRNELEVEQIDYLNIDGKVLIDKESEQTDCPWK